MSIEAQTNTKSAIIAIADLLGVDKVTSEPAVLDEYSHDSWPVQTKLRMLGLHENRPDGVVFAHDASDVVEVLRIAAAHQVPVTARGLGSSVTGQPLPTRGGIVLDLSRFSRRLDIDPVDLTVDVDPGWNGGELERELNGAGFTLGHSPQSLLLSSVGGWVATSATGQFSSRYGGIEDLVAGLDIVTADGHVATAESLPRSAVGPDLKRLFIGSEGTLGVTTRVKLRIFPRPESRIVEAFWVPDVDACLTAMRRIIQSGQRPSLIRGYDEVEARRAMEDKGFEGCALFLGSEGMEPVVAAEHEWQRGVIASVGGRSLGSEPATKWLGRRFDFSSVERQLALPGGYAETIEVAHTWRHIERLYDALRADLEPLANEVNGHFSHAYHQGTSLYLILYGRVGDDVEAVERLREIWRVAMEVALREGAVLSHHHGAGLARAPYVRASLASSFPLLERLKSAFDPAGVLNPGKLGLA